MFCGQELSGVGTETRPTAVSDCWAAAIDCPTTLGTVTFPLDTVMATAEPAGADCPAVGLDAMTTFAPTVAEFCVVVAPTLNPTAFNAAVAAGTVMFWMSGTVTVGLPDETYTVIVDPVATVVPAVGSVRVTNPDAYSLLDSFA